MTSPQAKKPAAVTAPEAPELLSVLVTQKVLSAEQAEKVRRAQKVNGFGAEQAMLQLGFASDAQIAQALAAHAGLPYVKINPLDLDLDVVTKAIAGPFARRTAWWRSRRPATASRSRSTTRSRRSRSTTSSA